MDLESCKRLSELVLVGFASGIYLIANLGPGPRDGLMTGFQRVTGLPIAWVRASIEVVVVAIGWSLGGSIGLATIHFCIWYRASCFGWTLLYLSYSKKIILAIKKGTKKYPFYFKT